jgi:hypothetical protein
MEEMLALLAIELIVLLAQTIVRYAFKGIVAG